MSDSRALWIDGPVGKLAASLRVADQARASVVLAHPHPLYGGTLDNPVIFHTDRELNRRGLTTLRFNFRGVEGSDGFHDDGRGEIGDVAAAAAWVRGLTPGRPLILVGYSFGSRCAIAHAIADRSVGGVVAIGLPVRIWSFPDLPSLGRPLSVVQGTADEFGSIDEVEAVIANASPKGKLFTIQGASHLFPGRASEAASRVAGAVEEMIQGFAAAKP
jgi:alpha/beta superfamily hydrolase